MSAVHMAPWRRWKATYQLVKRSNAGKAAIGRLPEHGALLVLQAELEVLNSLELKATSPKPAHRRRGDRLGPRL
jgi:hypothetical protein